jgi:hypothetical protein
VTVKSDQHGFVVQAAIPALSQTIAIGGGSVSSTAFQVAAAPSGSYNADGTPILRPQQTLHVRLCGTSDCWVAFGPTPVAAVNGAGSILLPAGVPEYFWVYPGEFVACIQAAAGGFLNITEMVA